MVGKVSGLGVRVPNCQCQFGMPKNCLTANSQHCNTCKLTIYNASYQVQRWAGLGSWSFGIGLYDFRKERVNLWCLKYNDLGVYFFEGGDFKSKFDKFNCKA